MARLLLMEDDVIQGKLLKEGLEDGGHDVDVYEAASLALEALAAREYDLIVTDLLVQRDGTHVADGGMLLIGRLRKPMPRSERSWWLKVPIIAITGSISAEGGPNFLAVAKTLGADAVLRKPIRLDDLLQQIDQLLA